HRCRPHPGIATVPDCPTRFWGRYTHTGVGLGVSLGLGSFCLTVCLYPGVSEFVFGRLSFFSLIPYGCGFGCAKARLGPKGRSETCPYGGVGLSSFCLAACAYTDD